MKKWIKKLREKEVLEIIVLVVIIFLLSIILFLSYKYQHTPLKNEENSNQTELTEEEKEESTLPVNKEELSTPSIDESSITPTNTPSIETPSTPSEEEIPTKKEENVINYFKSQEMLLKAYHDKKDDQSVVDQIKSGFITIVDFFFYDKPIASYTWKELTNEAKIKVLKLALSIDHKIDSYFPNYKDTIKEGYQNIKAKLIKLYLDTTSLLCTKVGDKACTQAKEDFKTMKESFGFTFSMIKEAGGNLKEAIQTWYEIFSGKQ